MTREEIIKEAAAEHRDLVCCGFDDPIADDKEASFIAGAEWADEHPKHGTVNKREFIEKACEILDSMLYMRDCGDYDCVASAYDTVEDFINRFCEAMEE